MDLQEALIGRRTIRRFKQEPVLVSQVEELIGAASLAPSAANRLPLRYVAVMTPGRVAAVFKHTGWGGQVTPKRSPVPGRSAPPCFVAVGAEAEQETPVLHADAGAAIQNMLLKAYSMGLGACWLGSFDRARLREQLNLPGRFLPLYLVALGYPDETPELVRIKRTDATPYYLTADDRLRVPKYEVGAVLSFR